MCKKMGLKILLWAYTVLAWRVVLPGRPWWASSCPCAMQQRWPTVFWAVLAGGRPVGWEEWLYPPAQHFLGPSWSTLFTFGVLSTDCTLEHVQQWATRMARGWNIPAVRIGWVSWACWVWGRGEFREIYKQPTGTCEEIIGKIEPDSSQLYIVEERDNRNKLNPVRFRLDKGRNFNDEDYEAMGRDARRLCVVSFPTGFRMWQDKALGSQVWSQSWLCFEEKAHIETSWGPFHPELFCDLLWLPRKLDSSRAGVSTFPERHNSAKSMA